MSPGPRMTITISATDREAMVEALDALRHRMAPTDPEQDTQHDQSGEFRRATTRWESR